MTDKPTAPDALPEREFDHFSIVPFKAICGADRTNQTTSQTPERVKCPICWQYWNEWNASRTFQVRSPSPTPQSAAEQKTTMDWTLSAACEIHAWILERSYGTSIRVPTVSTIAGLIHKHEPARGDRAIPQSAEAQERARELVEASIRLGADGETNIPITLIDTLIDKIATALSPTQPTLQQAIAEVKRLRDEWKVESLECHLEHVERWTNRYVAAEAILDALQALATSTEELK